MLEAQHPYSFESGGGLRAAEAAEDHLRRLEARLGFREAFPADVFRVRLRDLVINCHLSIDWYQRKIKREIRRRFWYFAFSLALLALIPVALLLATKYLPEGADTTTKIAAVLTGLLAFYRGISAWLDKRQVVAGYSKAMSDLKELLYTFEQKWDGAATMPEREGEFVQAIRDAIAASRSIVRQETHQYFCALAYPTFDIADMLSASGQQAKGLIGQSAGTPRPAPAAVPDPEIAQLRSMVDALGAQVNAALKDGGDPGALNDLLRLRDEAVERLRTAQLARG
jgi:hypothetical protein